MHARTKAGNSFLPLASVTLALLILSASPTIAADTASDPETIAKTVPKEDPYKPGETIAAHRGLPTDCWPQLANTPQRTNYTPMKFDPPQGKCKWTICLRDLDVDNLIAPTVQVVIGDGRVYVGCKNGRLYALDASTGAVCWTFQADGPIIHTAGYRDGRVFIAAMDGCVHALNAATGKQQWVFATHRRFGFSTAVLLADNKIFAVDRGGRLFALNPGDGTELWHYDAVAPVDQSPAFDAGKVFFAGEDMCVHAVNAADGTMLWKTEKLPGLSFRWFHPVVVNGKVIVRSASYIWTDHTQKQQAAGKAVDDPAQRSLFALDADSGKQTITLKGSAVGHDGTQPPPAVTRDGMLLVEWHFENQFDDAKESILAFALEDMRSQQIIMPLLETQRRAPDLAWNQKTPWVAGAMAPNENFIPSVMGDVVMIAHRTGFYNAGGLPYGGTFDLLQRRWFVQTRWHGDDPTAFAAWPMYGGDGNEDGGSNAASAANGLLYHHLARFHRIMCYEPLTAPTTREQTK